MERRQNLKDPKYVQNRFEKADFAYFAATWWPEATPEFLLLEIFALIWIFMWDDEIDTTHSYLGVDFRSAEEYRSETLHYISAALGVQDNCDVKDTTSNILISSFGDVANLLVGWDLDQKKLLYHEIENFVHGTSREQRRRLHEHLPTAEAYLECRMHTSGVGFICFGLLNYMTVLTEDATISETVKEITKQVNIIISIENDVLSLRKELEAGVPDSIVPILWLSFGNLQKAVNEAAEMLEQARNAFDVAERLLLEQCPPRNLTSVQQFLHDCKTNCTGNLEWSLKTQRYGINLLERDQTLLEF